MRRGINHLSALSTRHQFLSILSEGTRMSRKNSRLRHFLACFGQYMIDFIITHNSLANRRLLLTHFRHAIWNTANNHMHSWRITGSQLWSYVFQQILTRLRTQNYHPSMKRLVLSALSGKQSNVKHLPPSRYQLSQLNPTDLPSSRQPKHRRLNP